MTIGMDLYRATATVLWGLGFHHALEKVTNAVDVFRQSGCQSIITLWNSVDILKLVS